MVYSERKAIASGASRIPVATPSNHLLLESPAIRVPLSAKKHQEDDHGGETTPLMSKPKAVSRLPERTPIQQAAARPAIFALTESKVVVAAPAPPVVEPVKNNVASNLTSALAAAYKATASGREHLARRIYEGILKDSLRFPDVRQRSLYWISLALFEEHCGNYVASLRAYEEALEKQAAPVADVESNMCVFMMRMEERVEKALLLKNETTTTTTTNEANVEKLREFVVCVKNIKVSKEEEEEKKEEVVGSLVGQQVQQLMASVVSDPEKVAAADSHVMMMEQQRQRMMMSESESTTPATEPRRSARLAEKARRDYTSAVPWWMEQEESEWWWF